MPKIAGFIIWICSKFTKAAIEQIIAGLVDAMQDRNHCPLAGWAVFEETAHLFGILFRLIRYCSHPLFFSHAVSSLRISSHDPGTMSVK
jgi:hypothetical protein